MRRICRRRRRQQIFLGVPSATGTHAESRMEKVMLKRERTHRARTGMVKKVVPRLRDPASWLPLAAGASSRSLFSHVCRCVNKGESLQTGAKRFSVELNYLESKWNPNCGECRYDWNVQTMGGASFLSQCAILRPEASFLPRPVVSSESDYPETCFSLCTG